ncbi:hypothetical protein BLL61_08035 [Lacticaseibacillus casei]|nr:hypothetical protein BLL61_08035 [Lacticaseibacillus casei]
MESKTQVVKFEAYQALTEKDGQESKLDLEALFDAIKDQDQEKRSSVYFGTPVRMDNIHDVAVDDISSKLFPEMRLIYFHLTKLRDEGAATTTIQSEELKDLDLAPDEYIAEDINCFYDTQLCTVFIQRNFHSLSITGITDYLIKMYKLVKEADGNQSENEALNLFFKPVPDKKVVEKAQQANNFRTLELSFASDRKQEIPKMVQKFLGNLGDIFGQLGGAKIGLTLSAGKSDQPGLKNQETQEIIKQIADGNTPFSKAIIRGKAGDMPIERYDLLAGKLQTVHKFSSVKDENGSARKMHLSPSAVEDTMNLIYLKGEEGKQSFRERVILNLS